MTRHQIIMPLCGGAGLIALAGATGMAFAGWVDNGARIFMVMAESGLAWCF